MVDCFRPEGPWDPDFERRVEENRFYSLPHLNLSLSFIQVFGGFPVHGHFPGLCRGGGGGVPERCSATNMTREALAASARVLVAEEYDANPGSEGDWSWWFDWTGDVPTVLEHIVPNMDVDTLIFNTGLWGEMMDPVVLRRIMAAGSAAVRQAPDAGGGRHGNAEQPRCLWKRTTSRFACRAGARRCSREEWERQDTGDAVPLAVASEMGWGVYDSAKATTLLEQNSYADGIHFRPFIYQELNNLLLNVLCPNQSEG